VNLAVFFLGYMGKAKTYTGNDEDNRASHFHSHVHNATNGNCKAFF
jgi:hypothetical protein